MKVIDLLNKIANGEEVPKKIRIDHWCYKFEWIEHESNYYDKHEDIDLMSCLSMDEEELNYEVHEIEEEKKIPEKLDVLIEIKSKDKIGALTNEVSEIQRRFNQLIDYFKSKGE